MLVDELHHRRRQRSADARGKAEENHAARRPRCCIDELSEIPILGHENAPFAHRHVDDRGILRATRGLRYRNHVVTGVTQGPHNTKIAAFVGQEAHSGGRLENHGLLMGERVCRIGNGRLDIVLSEVRIGFQQVLRGGALRELPQDKLYRDPRSANDRLSEHHLRVDFDPTLH
jgi:hypothetical protein